MSSSTLSTGDTLALWRPAVVAAPRESKKTNTDTMALVGLSPTDPEANCEMKRRVQNAETRTEMRGWLPRS